MTDGDYTTYTCLNRDMVAGDTYTLELYEPTTIENVRICMGTTNGDYPKTALLSVSTDNHNWTSPSRELKHVSTTCRYSRTSMWLQSQRQAPT